MPFALPELDYEDLYQLHRTAKLNGWDEVERDLRDERKRRTVDTGP